MSKSSFKKIILCFVLALAVVGVGWRMLKRDELPTTEAGWIVDRGTTNGKKLVGTEDISTSGGFSVSPDGQWIIYPSDRRTILKPFYVLYDVKKQKRHEVVLSPRAKELSADGYGPDGAGCWDTNENKVYITGGPLFVLDPQSDKLQLEVIEDFEQSKWRFYDDCISPSDAAIYIDVIQHSPREIHLVDAGNPQKILARHTAGLFVRGIFLDGYGSSTERKWIEYLSYSPDFKQVAYTVGGYMLFQIPSRGYVLDFKSGGAAKPTFLATDVYGPIRWGPDSNTVYATVVLGGYGDNKGIYV
jgi:hypothetical protein